MSDLMIQERMAADRAIRVLLVEDDPADAGLVRAGLRRGGAVRFEVRHVERLGDGLSVLGQGQGSADVVLLDLSLPDSHGFETIRAVRAAHPAVPVIVLTGLDDTEFAVAAVESGAQDFLVKGQADGALMQRSILYAIKRHHLEDAVRLSEERFKAIFTLAYDAIVVADSDRRIRLFNPAAERMFGYRAEEMVGQTIERLLQPERRDRHTAGYDRFVRDGDGALPHNRAACLYAMRNDGSSFPIEVSVSTFTTPQGPLFTAMVRDVTAQMKAREELERQAADMCALAERLDAALAQAEQASRAKSEFLAVMSHEIRTPMNGVLGMARLVLDGDLAPEQRERLEIVQDSGEALMAILNDVLDFSKLEAGRVELENAAFSVRRMVSSTVGLLTSRAAEKGLDLKVEVADGVPAAMTGDVGRLRQILLNLVGNAVKFTDAGHVAVSIRPLETQADGRILLRFEVADTGIGIAEEAQDRLFQSFSQADSSISRRFGGTGLGLAICKRLVGLMDGRIGVTGAPGQGSRFWFEVALESVAPTAEEAAAAPAEPKGPLSILMAEDNVVNQKVGVGILKRLGHRVTVVADGAAAVTAVRSWRFDAVLMDMQMPTMDGLEATRQIRALDGDAAQVPIIALTANAMPGDDRRCFAAGMDGYVRKPIVPAELNAALARHVGGYSCAPQHAPPVEAVFDAAVLARLDEAVGPDTVEELIALFVEDVGERARALLAACGNGDLAATRSAAHEIKSTAATMGLTVLSRHAEAIEHACRDEKETEAALLSRTLDADVEAAVRALTEARLPVAA